MTHAKQPLTEELAGLRKRVAELETAEAECKQAVEDERRRIGRELHNDLAQRMTGISLMAEALRKKLLAEGHSEASEIKRILDHLNEMNLQTHRLIQELANDEENDT